MKIQNNLKIEIYSDGADIKTIKKYNSKNFIKGFTTNPTLMKLSGIKEYSKFANQCLKICKKKPISFEVVTDSLNEMFSQAKIISSWGDNVFVKIPIVNSKGVSTISVIKKLIKNNIKLNVTAVFTSTQVSNLKKIIDKDTNIIISIFAGRIADTGIDPINIVKNSVKLFNKNKHVKILWASPREILNLVHANNSGCHIITLTDTLLKKMELFGKSHHKYSVETSKMFYSDSKSISFN